MFELSVLSYILIGLVSSLIIGKLTIEKLRKFKFGQSIREEGPKSHYIKSGTPTMGGIIFLSSLLIILGINFKINYEFYIIFIGIFGLGIIGFIDDVKIVVNKSNDGLKPKEKMAGQIVVATIISFIAYYTLGGEVFIPFIKQTIDLGYIYIPFNIVFVVALTNSVNLTDGLDGLSTSVTIIVLSFLVVALVIMGGSLFSIKIALGLIGALFGFLYYNWNPAKVFMGDVGSLALGGVVAVLAMLIKVQLIIPFIGIVYFMETLSVIIQVVYFKKTGKRVFKMTPIHHHYELIGFNEKTIVKKFSIYTVVGFIISYLLIY